MCNKCEKCGKVAKTRYDIGYDEEMEMNVCGTCYSNFVDSVEQHEIDNRRRLQEANEY